MAGADKQLWKFKSDPPRSTGGPSPSEDATAGLDSIESKIRLAANEADHLDLGMLKYILNLAALEIERARRRATPVSRKAVTDGDAA